MTFERDPLSRYAVHEKYSGGGPKSYRDTVTGEILSLRQYRKLKANGYESSEAFGEPPELDASPEVDAPPPPPQREWMQYGSVGGSDPQDFSFWGRIGPGIFNVARGGLKIALSRTGHDAAADYIPPAQLATPVLKPAFRIMDRHLPIKIAVSGSADIRDLLELVAGAEKLIDFWSERAAEHRALEDEYEEAYGDEESDEGDDRPEYRPEHRASAPRTGPSDRTPSGKPRRAERSAGSRARSAVAALSTWRLSGGADGRNGGAERGSRSTDDGGDDTDAPANGRRSGGGAAIDPERGRSIIRDLLAADAAGRLATGLG